MKRLVQEEELRVLVNYLGTRPYHEVWKLITMVQSFPTWFENKQPLPEGKVRDDKGSEKGCGDAGADVARVGAAR